jgi:NAD(P)H-hydrate epimerase
LPAKVSFPGIQSGSAPTSGKGFNSKSHTLECNPGLHDFVSLIDKTKHMLKIFSTAQVRNADAYTIANEPIASVDLMERAATACYKRLKTGLQKSIKRVLIYCGPGNNGGDGLVIARMLWRDGIDVVAVVDMDSELSHDNRINLERYRQSGGMITSLAERLSINPDDLVIDAIFGSGLSKPVKGKWSDIITEINESKAVVVSIDIPSGLFADSSSDPKAGAIIRADHTLSLQFPKLAFMFAENEEFTCDWEVIDIGLHKGFIESEPSNDYLITIEDIKQIIRPRKKFSHKGSYGHALLISSSRGKTGAAILASKACLRSGAGLVTVHVPCDSVGILQTTVPEAMVSADILVDVFSALPKLDCFTAIGSGPGIGTAPKTQNALKLLIQETKVPLILDADALNILSENKTWLGFLPPGTILTPHPKEFERLAGKTVNSFDRLETLRKFSVKFNCYVVLKGANTVIATPQGECWFNPTGNPGMATGGSGDVLTGIITGLAAQGYSRLESCLLGVYLHGLAGDISAAKSGYEALIAGDIVEKMGKAWKVLHGENKHGY